VQDVRSRTLQLDEQLALHMTRRMAAIITHIVCLLRFAGCALAYAAAG
jgi:hypothetical protein